MMKRAFGKMGWLVVSICFFGLACLGVALDGPDKNTTGPPKQSSKQETSPTKAPTPTTQGNSSAQRKGPEVSATTPPPAASTDQLPKFKENPPLPPVQPVEQNGVIIDNISFELLVKKLEQDKSHYPIQVWCHSVAKCGAMVVPNVNGTQWEMRAYMNTQSFQDANTKYSALGYRLVYRQELQNVESIYYQALWLKD